MSTGKYMNNTETKTNQESDEIIVEGGSPGFYLQKSETITNAVKVTVSNKQNLKRNQKLNNAERQVLTECESRIKAGIDQFIQVGKDLLTIRDGRLYREKHKTFEAYCEKQWGISRSYGYDLIKAAQIHDTLTQAAGTTLIENVSQSRALAKLDKQDQVKVMQAAKEDVGEGKITAKAIRKAAEKIKPIDATPKKVELALDEIAPLLSFTELVGMVQEVQESLRHIQIPDRVGELLKKVEEELEQRALIERGDA